MTTKEHGPNSSANPPVTRTQGSDVSRIANLVLGDVLVFLIFAVIGINNHKETATVSHVLLTALPFLVGWFIVSPLIGAFRRTVTAQPRQMAQRTLLAWIPAWVIAMVLRGIFVDRGIPPWTFALIAFVANLVLLLIWRLPYALTKGRKR